MKVGTPEAIKKVNRTVILELVRREGPISRAAIARRIQLSPPTVSGIVSELLEEELVIPVGLGTAASGRRPMLLDYNADAGLVIAVDAAGAAITVAVLNLGGTVLARRRTSVKNIDPVTSVQLLLAEIQSTLGQLPSQRKVLGIGIGAPGVTNVRTGTVEWAPTLSWRDLALRDIVSEATGLPVFVDNDMNMAVQGEAWVGAAKDATSAIFIAVRDGLGSGVVLNQRLWRGHNNAAGEVGYLVVERNVLGHDTRDFGGLERLAAEPAVLRRFRQEVGGAEALDGAGGLDAATAVEAVVAAAGEGHEGALRAIDETCEYLAMAVANVSALLNPELVVMQSHVAGLMDLVIPRVDAIVELLVPYKPAIVHSQLGDDAVLYGATLSVLRMSSGGLSLAVEMP